MSIPVTLDDLPAALGEVGPAYLLTSGADGRVKAVSVVTSYDAGRVVAAHPGRGSLANAGANPTVTLLFPPGPDGVTAPGFSLLVDGVAEVSGDDVVVAPTGAVWHKPAR